MWGRVELLWTYVSEERNASIFCVEKSASQKPAWAAGCRLSVTVCEYSYPFVFQRFPENYA
jgi:hypothetical protein